LILFIIFSFLFYSCSSSVSATISNCNEISKIEEENQEQKNDEDFFIKHKSTIIQFGTKENDLISSVAIKNDIIIVAGTTTGAFPTTTNYGHSDSFISKFSKNKQLWIKQFGTPNWDMATSITILQNGNFLVTGNTNGTLQQETTEIIGNTDIYVSKFDINGKLIWKKTFGTSKSDFSSSITTDSKNNIFVCGWTYGNFSGRNFNDNSADILLLKISQNGKILNKREISSNFGEDKCFEIKSFENNIYIAGTTNGTMSGEKQIGKQDGVLIKTDNTLFTTWIKQFGSLQKDLVSGIEIKEKKIFITGTTSGNFNKLKTSGIEEGFIAKFNINGNLENVTEINKYSTNEVFAITSNNKQIFVTGNLRGNFSNTKNNGKTDIFIFSPTTSPIQIGTTGNENGFTIKADLKKIVVGGWTDNQFKNNKNYGKTDAFLLFYYLDN